MVRDFVLVAEPRDFALAAETRDFALAAETRDFALAAETRDFALAAETRDFSVNTGTGSGGGRPADQVLSWEADRDWLLWEDGEEFIWPDAP